MVIKNWNFKGVHMQLSQFLLFGLGLLCGIRALYADVQDNSGLIDGHIIECQPILSGTTEEISSQSAENVSISELGRKRKPFREVKITRTDNPDALLSSMVSENSKTNPIETLMDGVNPFASESETNASLVQFFNFTAVTLAETGAFPPDTMGVAGPAQFVAFCNGRLKSFSKSTGLPDGVLNVNTDTFFASVLPSGAFTSDPRIRYDRSTQSWILTMIDVPSTNTVNDILIAVTQSPVITAQSVWTFYSFKPSANYGAGVTPFADFPTLGIDSNALYIGVNIFNGSIGSFVNTAAFVIPKGPLLNSSSLQVSEFPNLIDSSTSVGPFAPQGVDVFNSDNSIGFFIGVNASTQGSLVLRTVTNPGTTPQISANIPFTVLSTVDPLNVPHLGNTNGVNGYLDAIDTRLSSSHVRGTYLFTSHNVGVDYQGISSPSADITRDGCRWYQIDISNPNSPTLNQAGTLFQPNNPTSTNERFYWMPSIMTNGVFHILMGCSTAGAHEYANAAIAGRFVNDPSGYFWPPYIYTSSTTAYNPPGDPGGSSGRRWGDYSHVSVDPNDDLTLWAIEEFCNATNSYGCRVLRYISPPPPSIASVSPSTISANQPNLVLTITGTANVSGQGAKAYFDPGPCFANRLNVNIQDVQILSTQVISQTQIKVVISTVGTTTGSKTITITNPDGQAIQASGLLTVQ